MVKLPARLAQMPAIYRDPPRLILIEQLAAPGSSKKTQANA
jgi:hypothetical protein